MFTILFCFVHSSRGVLRNMSHPSPASPAVKGAKKAPPPKEGAGAAPPRPGAPAPAPAGRGAAALGPAPPGSPGKKKQVFFFFCVFFVCDFLFFPPKLLLAFRALVLLLLARARRLLLSTKEGPLNWTTKHSQSDSRKCAKAIANSRRNCSCKTVFDVSDSSVFH